MVISPHGSECDFYLIASEVDIIGKAYMITFWEIALYK
jgi:hypothetical protein